MSRAVALALLPGLFACAGPSRPGEGSDRPDDPPTGAAADPAGAAGGSGQPDAPAASTPVAEPFRASGVEPFWSVRVDAEAARLERPGEAPFVARAPSLAAEGEARVYTVPDGAIRVVAEPGLCRDDATGMPHPYRVTLTFAGETLRGCGGDPATLLAGEWVVERIADAEVAPGTRATLAFDVAASRVAGDASCNRFTAGYALGGEGLRIEPLATTRMMCPPPRMQQEARLLEVLGAVTRFDVEEGEVLVLHTDDGRTLRARRPR